MSSIPPRRTKRPDWADLAEYTVATQRKYCAKWGYDYHLDVSDLWEQPCGTKRGDRPGAEVPIYYKIKFILFEHFLQPEKCGKEYDWVVWLDSDLLITNYEMPLESFMHGLSGSLIGYIGDIVLTHDVNGLHATVIMLRRSPYTLGFAWANKEAGMRYFLEDVWSDQLSMRMMLQTPPYSEMVRYESVKTLCAMPSGIYPIPEEARKIYEWDEKESLALHLSALSMEKRIEISKSYCERLKLLE